MYQTHAGYFMAADRRMAIADRMKSVPMGFFNDNSLGQVSGVCTTVVGSIETMVPIVMVNILSGLITTAVFTVVILVFDWRIGLIRDQSWWMVDGDACVQKSLERVAAGRAKMQKGE